MNLGVLSIACPSRRLCLAVDEGGGVLVSHDPAARMPLWHRREIDGSHVPQAIACPSQQLCEVVDGDGGLLSSASPGALPGQWGRKVIPGRRSRWVRAPIADTSPLGLSCPSAQLCAAVDGNGGVSTTTDPTSGAWGTATVDTAGPPVGISCPSERLCVAIDEFGLLFVTQHPTGPTGTWASRRILSSSHDLIGVSCSSTGLCVAGDARGEVLTTDNVTSPATLWHPSVCA